MSPGLRVRTLRERDQSAALAYLYRAPLLNLALADLDARLEEPKPGEAAQPEVLRAALGIDKALNEIVRGKGRFYDPEVVKACLAVFKGNRYGFEAEEECRPRGAGAMMC